jgi:nitrite reductase/ring-hydroxylating ferredoxin subunit
MASNPPTWHEVAAIDQIPPGAVLEVVADGAMVALANVGGQIHAIDGVCAHQGGPLGKGKLVGCTLTCPWHGWQYDVATGRQVLSSTIRQASFAVRVEGDRILVCVSPPLPHANR